MGSRLLSKVKKEAGTLLWCLGRLGARIPVYGPLSCVIPAEKAAEWLTAILTLDKLTAEAASAIAQLGFHTGDPRRDIEVELRREVVKQLNEHGFSELAQSLERVDRPTAADIARAFGESLPKGMHFVSSTSCMLPIAGLVVEEKAG
jgi:hypothetical protein